MSFMDAREHGSKVGSGGVASQQQANVDRRERLRRLALETIDLAKDPYFMKNHRPTGGASVKSDLARERGELSGAHAREEASTKFSEARGERCARRDGERAGAHEDSTEKDGRRRLDDLGTG